MRENLEHHPARCLRGAPHSGLSALIRRISARRSASICGRPPRERDFSIPGHLFGSLPGTTRFPNVRARLCSAPVSAENLARARANVQPAAQVAACSRVDVNGIPLRFPGDPSCAFAATTPAEPTIPLH